MSKHEPIFCAACRVMVLVPVVYDGFGNGTKIVPGDPWIKSNPHWFCCADCIGKGPAKLAWERVVCHVDWERGGAKASLERQRGRDDALFGFDCIGHRPEYVKGHGEGMALRDMVAKAAEEMGKVAR